MEVRDSTANSMVVLERGAGGVSTLIRPSSSRPPSGRQSRNVTPIQRSGSQLEVLPPEDESKKSNRSSGPHGHGGSADRESRQTLSAGSSGRRSRQGEESAANVKRASSVDDVLSSPREDAGSRPGSRAHKEVSLMTVKRNYETHGIPKNENWDFVPKDMLNANPTLTNGSSPVHRHECDIPGEKKGLHNSAEEMRERRIRGNGDGENTVSSEESTEHRLKYLMEQLSVKNKEIKQHDERRKSGHAAKRRDSSDTRKFPSTVMSDSYYVSTGTPAELREDAAGPSKKPSHAAPPFLEDRTLTEKAREDEEEEEDDTDSDNDEDEEEEEEEEEGPSAPIELMGEFLDAVMDEEYETADKLCKMILIYEPDNKECLQFKPLIEEMLRREWDHQLWGSDSDEDSDEESEGEDDDEDEDEETDSDEEDSDSDSSESEEEEEEDAQK
ncbi:uncharacterized protein [Diadema setosum]|uniref:uncharacterized protein isoform X1 n=1 Tax=Diadema setosum TaxID=31175 RepID=UPI003B3BD49D